MDLTYPESPEVDSSKAEAAPAAVASVPSNPMEEFYALRDELLWLTLAFSGILFCCVWWLYSLSTAVSYLLGAFVGAVYLGMLARNVERLNSQTTLSKNRLALFAVIIILACRLEQMQVLPVFLGFLTFKLAILCHTIRITLLR